MISFEEFQKLDIRVAKITLVEEIEGSDNLYKITLDIGDVTTDGLSEKVVVSGIKKWYGMDELIGRQVVYLSNLEPKTFKGIYSEGMLLAADDGRPVLLIPEIKVASGVKVR